MTKNTKKKIVILGGGMGAMVTAFELTSQPNWQDLYDITLYQLGWRLGGKCASGRNMTPHQPYEPDYRIQEHGFHIFFGFYANTFRVMKECYDALGNEKGTFQGIENAFKPQSFIVLEDQDKRGRWVPWNINFPYSNDKFPWSAKDIEVGSPWEYILKMFEFMLHKHSDSPHLDSLSSTSRIELDPDREPIALELLPQVAKRLETPKENLLSSSHREVLAHAHQFAHSLPKDIQHHSPEDHKVLNWLLERAINFARQNLEDVIAKLEEKFEHLLLDAHRLLITLNLGYAIARGMMVNTIFDWQSFNDLDQHDFRTWVGQNGAGPETANSVLVQAMYEIGRAHV